MPVIALCSRQGWAVIRDASDHSKLGTAAITVPGCRSVSVDSNSPHVSLISLKVVIIMVDGNHIVITSVSDVQYVGKLSGAINP
jgi:mannose-1-phosphate guanylyltransferase/mannose-1-phosphate guanylyltransferase/mannose-6-phosphate isomerase